MSRKPVRIKTVNLEDGRPKATEALLLMEFELQRAREEKCVAVKLIHGYGSSGAGGVLRVELQKELRKAVELGKIKKFVPGENWRISDETTWELLKRFPEWKNDSDLGRGNQGISVVIL